MSKNKVASVSPLSGLTQLEDLDLHWNDDIDDLSPLSGLSHLRRLILRRCAVGDISILSKLTSLQEIDLTECRIRDVSPLSGLSGLRQVNLYENDISDISSLTGLTNLRSLSLGDNPLDERAYENDLWTIAGNNPNAYIFYDSNPRPPTNVSASDGTHQDRIAVNWSEVPNGPRYTSYYRVFRTSSDHDTPTPISIWQTTTSYDDVDHRAWNDLLLLRARCHVRSGFRSRPIQ